MSKTTVKTIIFIVRYILGYMCVVVAGISLWFVITAPDVEWCIILSLNIASAWINLTNK